MTKTQLGLLIVSVCLFTPPVSAQATRWETSKERSGLETGYNRFEDYSIVRTKRNVVRGVVGKGNVFDPFANERVMEIVAAFSHSGQRITAPVPAVFLIIMTKASSGFGKVFQGLEKADNKERFYIAPGSKVIAIADGERLDFGGVSKSKNLNVWGEYSGDAFVSVPIPEFRKLAAAKKLELAVGGIEINFPKKDFFDRLAQLAAELDERSR